MLGHRVNILFVGMCVVMLLGKNNILDHETQRSSLAPENMNYALLESILCVPL